MEHLVSSFMGVKTASNLLHDSMKHHLQDNNSAKSDLDELRARASDYASELKMVNEQLETMKKSGVKSDIHTERRRDIIAEIAKANDEFKKVETRTAKTMAFNLPQLMLQIATAKTFIKSTAAGVIAVKYIQTYGEFNQILVAANQSLDERNRLFNRALDIQVATGQTTKETAEAFDGLRQRGVLYMDSAAGSLNSFSQSAAGVNKDFAQIVKSANMLSMATGVSNQEAIDLLATSQQLNTSYAGLVELANKLTKQTTMSGQGAVKLIEQISDLRAQYNIRGVGLEKVAEDIAAVQDALTSVGSRDAQMAIKFAGAISDITTSTGQFATMLGAGGEAVLADSGRFIQATENLAKFAGQYKNNAFQFKSIADSLDLSKLELSQIVKVFEEGKLGTSRNKLKETTSLAEDYEQQLANTGRVWRRALDSLIALAVKGIAPLTWAVDKLQGAMVAAQTLFDKFPPMVNETAKLAIGLGSVVAAMSALSGVMTVIGKMVPALAAFKLGGVASSAAGSAASAAVGTKITTALGKVATDISGALKSSMPGVALRATISGWFKIGLSGLKDLVVGTLSKIPGVASGLITGVLQSVIFKVAAPLAIITGILIWWKNRESKKNIDYIQGVYESQAKGKDVMNKAIRTFQDRAAAGASATELKELSRIQGKAAVDLLRRQGDIKAHEVDKDKSTAESLYDLFLGVKQEKQFTITDLSTAMAKQIVEAQAASAYRSGAVIGGQISMEAPRATITRLESLSAAQQEYITLSKQLNETSAGSKELLVKLTKLIEAQNQLEQQRAAEERSGRVIKNRVENPFLPAGVR